ncbi:MAG: DAK2 domain-containing protein, partial [Firmicutes bacterium]|nr:DAK2 domain-containing protein [Bacillota bacterium]
AAQQAKELVSCNLVIIATKNIPQGISAAINYDEDATIGENALQMQKSANAVRSGLVTHAVRDTESDGFDIKNGDIIGINGGIVARGSNVNEVARQVVNKLAVQGTASITLYFGEDVTEESASEFVQSLEEQYPRYDVSAYYGGQSHYFYFISVE